MHHHHSDVERVHTEPVVLDIGGQIGALIIFTDAADVGREIELSLVDQQQRLHNQVHARSFNGRTEFAAVYPDLQQGEYTVWEDDENPAGRVVIRGGEITSLDWRTRGEQTASQPG